MGELISFVRFRLVRNSLNMNELMEACRLTREKALLMRERALRMRRRHDSQRSESVVPRENERA